MASHYNGAADRLEQQGSPYSANNGAKPTGPLYTKNNGTTAARQINNTFQYGTYEQFVVDTELAEVDATGRAADESGTRTVGTRG